MSKPASSRRFRRSRCVRLDPITPTYAASDWRDGNGGVVELGVVGQHTHVRGRGEWHLFEYIIGPPEDKLVRRGKTFAREERRPTVRDHGAKTQVLGHRDQNFGDMHPPEHDELWLGRVNLDEHFEGGAVRYCDGIDAAFLGR